MLDRTEQRIVGVLIEKELSVPDSYPMSENALVDGCNQKSNRDPVLGLEAFQVAGAVMALQEKGWVARIDGGGRVPRFRHRVVDRLALDQRQLAVLAELLLRGAQAPGALKPRVARMGFTGSPEEIEAVLRGLAERKDPITALMPLAPRERDRRWQHLLGDGKTESGDVAAHVHPVEHREPEPIRGGDAGAGAAVPGAGAARTAAELASRVAALEHQLAALREEVAALKRAIASRGAPAD